MPKYRVLAGTLDKVDHASGYKEDGSPKKITSHTQGDVIDWEDDTNDRAEELVAHGALAPADKDPTVDLDAAQQEVVKRQQALSEAQANLDSLLASQQPETPEAKADREQQELVASQVKDSGTPAKAAAPVQKSA